MTLVTVT